MHTVGDLLAEMDAERAAQFRPDLEPAEYFAEPCPAPALSSSGVTTLLYRSPLHFWHAHPALGGGAKAKDTAATYRGSLVHRLALGKGDDFRVLPFDDYRTKEAREARDACIADGVIPVKPAQMAEAEAMADRIRDAIDAACGGNDYQTEVVIAGQINGIWQRCMVDVWCPSLQLALDVKTAAKVTDAWLSRAFANGYARQDAFYTRLIDAATGDPGRNRFAFLFVEGEEPFIGRTARVDEAYRTGARSEIARAERIFTDCMAKGEWPGPGEFIATPPAWAMSQWIEAEMEEAA